MAAANLLERNDSETISAFSYLNDERGLSEETIKAFELGYMPFGIRKNDGSLHELAGKIIIPIRDAYGDLIAVSSRNWREGKKRQFWHETYAKSLHLFGLSIAKSSIIKHRKAIVVEGEFDVFSMHEFGLGCTVGTMGTTLKLYQLSLLNRYAEKIYILFDGDEAGQRAANKIQEFSDKNYLSGYDVKIIIVRLADCLDPDEFLKQRGKTDMIKLMKASDES